MKKMKTAQGQFHKHFLRVTYLRKELEQFVNSARRRARLFSFGRKLRA